VIEITLPDGSIREFDNPVTVMDVAKSIGSGLAKATLAGEVDGKLVDASHEINTNASLSIVTDKDEKGLEIIRHSTAHLMAQATQMLYPEAQVTIGPVIDDGFYYDFSYKDGFTESDLEKIEKNMSKLVSQNLAVKRFELSRDEAVDFFKNKGEFYKAEIIESIPQDEILSLYEQGDFVDLCRGPHVPSTGKLKAFKLMKLAGAYWRGDSNNEMLQRVYGTAWSNKQDLEEYIHR
jgi:threonyl-tRNA synthetase